MRITLKEPELELEVHKVDTPTGVGWCVILPEERKMLIKFHNGKWETMDNASDQFVQAIGYEINQFLESDQSGRNYINYSSLNQRPKRVRMVKYLLL
jgi:hypothetical protein